MRAATLTHTWPTVAAAAAGAAVFGVVQLLLAGGAPGRLPVGPLAAAPKPPVIAWPAVQDDRATSNAPRARAVPVVQRQPATRAARAVPARPRSSATAGSPARATKRHAPSVAQVVSGPVPRTTRLRISGQALAVPEAPTGDAAPVLSVKAKLKPAKAEKSAKSGTTKVASSKPKASTPKPDAKPDAKAGAKAEAKAERTQPEPAEAKTKPKEKDEEKGEEKGAAAAEEKADKAKK